MSKLKEVIKMLEERKIDNYYSTNCKCILDGDYPDLDSFTESHGKGNQWWINLEDFRDWVEDIIKFAKRGVDEK